MKYKGNGIVWDAENDKPLAEFIGGSFETNEDRIIDKLDELGFESEGEQKTFEEMTVAGLKKLAKAKEIEGYSNMKKEELIEALKNVG
jgi:hypothetical protein